MQTGIDLVVRRFITSGFQLSPDVIDLLQTIPMIDQFVDDALRVLLALKDRPFVITKEILNRFVGPSFSSSTEIIPEKESPKKIHTPLLSVTPNTSEGFKPLAKEYESSLEVVRDPSESLTRSTNKAKDFANYFRDRFNRLKAILKQHPDIGKVDSIAQIKGANVNTEVIIVGMVREKRETKSGNHLLVIEDLEDELLCVVSKKHDDVYRGVNNLLVDQVIALRGKLVNKEMAYIEEVIWPDIPMESRQPHSSIPLCAALLSDLHIGSKEFLEAYFRRFILWLGGKIGDNKQQELAGRVKYVVIAGDLVDGIGIYPNQEDDLEIKDIFAQYDKVASLLREIPEYIQIIIIPGNHDAVRLPLPQPAIPEKFLKPALERGSVVSLGNPSAIKLNKVNCFLYHGTSLNDMIAQIPNTGFVNGHLAMIEFLRGRHIAPIWGATTPIAPESRDWLVIEEVPQIFLAGHIHINSLSRYRSTWLINSGTFQAQTEFMRMAGITPTPGIITIADLKQLTVQQLSFN